MALVVIAYHVAHDPGPIMYQAETLPKAKAFSKDRVAPMARDMPALRGIFRPSRTRDSGNTLLHKQFRGGSLTMVGANSAADLSSRPCRIWVPDEFAAYEATSEGDPYELANTRTRAFEAAGNAVKFGITSPRLKDDRSERLWLASDQRRWFVTCPDCKAEHYLKWRHVHWEKDANGRNLPETARYACEGCGSAWDDTKRRRAVRRGRFKATAPFRGIAGFHKNEIAGLGRPLRSIVSQWLEAQGHPELLQVFTNTVLAEWWDPRGEAEAVDGNEIARRREHEAWVEVKGGGDLPPGPILLTIGVDVQRDRIEYEIVGWAEGFESWSVRYDVIWGDVRTVPDVLTRLDEILLEPFKFADGRETYILGAGVDAGYSQATITRFTKPRLRRMLPNGRSQFVFALKGRGNEPTRPVWPKSKTKIERKKAQPQVWTIGTDQAAEEVLGRLAIVDPTVPGYSHFPKDRGLGYFEGLTAEQLVIRWKAGVPYRSSVLKHKDLPNEPFDCRKYAYAVMIGLDSMGITLKRERELLGVPPPPASQPRPNEVVKAGEMPDPTTTPLPPTRRGSGGDSFLSGRGRNWLRR